MRLKHPSPVLFYDGECQFCHKSVDFILGHESGSVLKFAWLQSSLSGLIIPPDAPDSLILLEEDTLYYKSTAALRLCSYLRAPYRWAKVLLIIPRPIRDYVYDFISANRKKIMGSTTCVLPIDQENRFL